MLQERDDEVRREAGLPAERQALEARDGLVRGAQAELELHYLERQRLERVYDSIQGVEETFTHYVNGRWEGNATSQNVLNQN